MRLRPRTRSALLALACTAPFARPVSADAERDAASSWNWLQANAPADDASSPFLATLIADRHGVDVDANFRRSATDAFAAEPLAAAFAPLLGRAGTDTARIDALGPWQRPLAAALACPERQLAPSDFVGVFERDRIDAYAVAHSVLGLHWAAERGCLSVDDVASARCLSESALRIALGQHPEVDDARAELLAVALHADLDGTVRPEDIDAVELLFAADGSWGPPEAENRYHATMVAAWADAEWARRDEALPSLVANTPRAQPQPTFLVAPAAALGCDAQAEVDAAATSVGTGPSVAAAETEQATEPPARPPSTSAPGCAGWR